MKRRGLSQKRMSSGFTLVELLVSVAILSVLSAVILASVTQARISGINAAIMQEAQSRQTAINLLLSNSGSFFPNPGNTTDYKCFLDSLDTCIFAGVVTDSNGIYDQVSLFLPPKENSRLSQLASAGPSLTPYYLDPYISGASYRHGLVAIGNPALDYDMGIFYRCAQLTYNVDTSSDDCTAANIYWTQKNTNTCKKGQIFVSGNNSVVCYEAAQGGAPSVTL